MTEPAPEKLAAMGWTGEEGISDMRMFVHYFRKTIDGRVLMGSGSGPISYGGGTTIAASARRQRQRLARRTRPAPAAAGIDRCAGRQSLGRADRYFRRPPALLQDHARHAACIIGCGYSGHGVNPTYIGGQCLASLVLDENDMWSNLPLCTRAVPSLPPEPFRYYGGRAVRRAILACEDAEERGQPAPLIATRWPPSRASSGSGSARADRV